MDGTRVRHLNCGTMRIPGATIVSHVLLVETPAGLTLVDTGYGTADIAAPARRLGAYRHISRPVLDPAETAVAQIRAAGLDPGDVRDIVLTHLDADHAGGLADFPAARVHLTESEWQAARHPATAGERARYRTAQWDHDPHIVTHAAGGDDWRGFAHAREVAGVVLIPMPGHTRGHAAVAVSTGDRWILHAGDAFYDHSVLTGTGREPLALRLQERAVAVDRARVRDNHRRLAALHRRADPDLLIVSAHDPALLAAARDERVVPPG